MLDETTGQMLERTGWALRSRNECEMGVQIIAADILAKLPFRHDENDAIWPVRVVLGPYPDGRSRTRIVIGSVRPGQYPRTISVSVGMLDALADSLDAAAALGYHRDGRAA